MSEPHIYRHIAPKARPLLDLLVQPGAMTDVVKSLGVADGTGFQNRVRGLCDMLGIDRESGTAWRVALVRIYYGIDPCWCQA